MGKRDGSCDLHASVHHRGGVAVLLPVGSPCARAGSDGTSPRPLCCIWLLTTYIFVIIYFFISFTADVLLYRVNLNLWLSFCLQPL